jgi:Rrf2 family protein
VRFSTKGDYGLALIVGLARSENNQPLSLRQLALTERVPFGYAEQLVGKLRRAKLVRSVRGTHGGYRLMRSPGKITVGDVVRALEEDGLVTCQRHVRACPRESVCYTHGVWSKLQASLHQAMDRVTIRDLASA